MEKMFRDWKAVLVFVGPALLVYASVLFIPIVWSTVYSVYEGSPIRGFEFVGFSNYVKLLQDRDFLHSLWFSAKYAAVVTTGQIFFGLLLALMYVFYLRRGSSLIRTIVFFPVVLPTVAVAKMFQKLFEIVPQYGLVNALLDLFHLDSWIQPWLGQGNTAFWVAAIMNIWTAMGFYAVMLYAGLIEIPDELIEAARLDGAKGWSLVRFIILPLLTPILVTSLIFSLNGTLKVFDQLLALTGGGPGLTTTPLTLYMYKTAFAYDQYGYGSTIALILALECLLVTVLIYRFARREVA